MLAARFHAIPAGPARAPAGAGGCAQSGVQVSAPRWLGGDLHRPLLRSGRCLSYGHGITYWPLGEVLKEHFGILESDPPEVVAGRLGGREGLGFTLGLAPSEGMHPLTVRDRLQTSWVGFLTELTAKRPAAVLVEDLHWAGDELCELLQMLAERVDFGPRGFRLHDAGGFFGGGHGGNMGRVEGRGKGYDMMHKAPLRAPERNGPSVAVGRPPTTRTVPASRVPETARSRGRR